MRLSNKTIALVLCIILCTSMTALGTVAYFTDRDSVTNTFTVGKVQITVDESKIDTNSGDVLVNVDTDGNGTIEQMTMTEAKAKNFTEDDWEVVRTKSGVEGQDKNEYKLVPGAVYTKDPTMTVEAGSEESFVRMVVTINCINALNQLAGGEFLPQNFVNGTWNQEKWPCEYISDTKDNTKSYYFNYFETVSGLDENGNPATEDKVLESLFTQIKVPTELTQEAAKALENLTIKIEGHAIQAATFDGSADAAWAAFDEQGKPATNP